MDPNAVTTAIAELAPMLQADGADLTLIEANPATARIEVRLRSRRRDVRGVRPAGPAAGAGHLRHDRAAQSRASSSWCCAIRRTAGASGH